MLGPFLAAAVSRKSEETTPLAQADPLPNSTVASANITANADPAKTDGSGRIPTCTRFFPFVGQSISVPCE
jgi:hypothetical protein